jgi:cation diffusion facilitator family transporter
MLNDKLEKLPLRISMIGTLFMAMLGFGFSIYTSSQAILLDGILSMVNFVVVLVSMRVVSQVLSPATVRFPFGFVQLEPFFNFFRGLLFLGVIIFACFSSVMVILEGGSEMILGVAVVYAIVALSGCFIIYFIIRYFHQQSPSAIVHLEMQGWFIDGLMSGVVLISFLIGYAIRDTTFSSWLPYLDSVIVLVICVIILPIPFKILKENLYELLLSAPEADISAQVEEVVAEQLKPLGLTTYELQVAKTGRLFFVYLLLMTDFNGLSIDDLRKELSTGLNNKSIPSTVLIELTRDNGFFNEMVNGELNP